MQESEFKHWVKESLSKLTNNQHPQWGIMKPTEMVDHLRKGVVLSMATTKAEILTPADKLPLYKKFLMSDKPFAQNLRKPPQYDEVASNQGDLEEAKEALTAAVDDMYTYFAQYPNHTAVHASFGELNNSEWLHLHKKHFSHHFAQFNL